MVFFSPSLYQRLCDLKRAPFVRYSIISSYCSFVLFSTSKSCSCSCPAIFLSSSVLSRVVMVFSNSFAWLALSFFLCFAYNSDASLILSFIISHRRVGETEGLFAYSLFVSWIVFLILVT